PGQAHVRVGHPGKGQQVVGQLRHFSGGLDDRVQNPPSLVIQGRGRVLLQHLRVCFNVTQRNAQVVRHCVRKRLHLEERRLNLPRSVSDALLKFQVQTANSGLGPPALADFSPQRAVRLDQQRGALLDGFLQFVPRAAQLRQGNQQFPVLTVYFRDGIRRHV